MFADLKPYICIFNDCGERHITFSTRKLWLDHMYKLHSQREAYCCISCGRGFPTPIDFDCHLRNFHAQHADGQHLASLCNSADIGASVNRTFASCPLCLRISWTSQDFYMHVARHMEDIALMTLPRELPPPPEPILAASRLVSDKYVIQDHSGDNSTRDPSKFAQDYTERSGLGQYQHARQQPSSAARSSFAAVMMANGLADQLARDPHHTLRPEILSFDPEASHTSRVAETSRVNTKKSTRTIHLDRTDWAKSTLNRFLRKRATTTPDHDEQSRLGSFASPQSLKSNSDLYIAEDERNSGVRNPNLLTYFTDATVVLRWTY